MNTHKINVRIHSDKLKETHLPGTKANLSKWSVEVIKHWEGQEKITRLPTVRNRKKTKWV